jgi:hypothetical protein
MRCRMGMLFVSLLCFCQLTVAIAADDRIWMETTINQKPVRFIFDTGSPTCILFRKSAERLGLAITNANFGGTNGRYTGITESCSMQNGQGYGDAHFYIIDLPPHIYSQTEADGVIGWEPVSKNVTTIFARQQVVIFSKKVPLDVSQWIKFQVLTNCPLLELVLKKPDGKSDVLAIDTGPPQGVKLNPRRWREWKLAHSTQPITLGVNFYPLSGTIVSEESLAKEINFGSLALTAVPVTEANPADLALGKNYEGTLGLAALKRLDLVVDANNGVAYLRPKTNVPLDYSFNRAGLVFTTDKEESHFIANVVKETPADAAGIQTGDVLVKFNGRQITGWVGDPPNINQLMCDEPPGTKMTFTLIRQKKEFEANVILEDFFKP